MRFREVLQSEFAKRKATNRRYSLRAFAEFFNADHSSLSQVLRGTRPMPVTRIRAWALRLGMTADEASIYVAAEHAASPEHGLRSRQLLHWTAEGLAVIESAVHFEILRLINAPGFQTDVRWISAQSGFSTDEVNMALTRLLRLRMIGMETQAWKDLTGLKLLTRENVRSLALKRIREAAAGDGIKLGRKPKQ